MKQVQIMSNRVVFWMSLLVLGVSALLIDFILMFIMLFVSPTLTYLFTLIVGLFFGFIFSFLIMDLYHLERKHHIFLSLYVPFIAVLSIYILMSGIKKLAMFLGVMINVSPIITSFFLLFSFSLPYLFFGLSTLFKK